MEKALRALLRANAGLSALTGVVDWGLRPQNDSSLPAVVLQRVYGGRDYHLTGASGLVESRVQADCYGETYGSAKGTANALMAIVNAYSATYDGVQFQRISIDSERDTNETEAADRHLFRTSIDLLIWHDE